MAFDLNQNDLEALLDTESRLSRQAMKAATINAYRMLWTIYGAEAHAIKRF